MDPRPFSGEELPDIEYPPERPSAMRGTVIALLIAILVTAVAVVGYIAYNNYKEQKVRSSADTAETSEQAAYEDDLVYLCYAVINGASKAEEAGNMTLTVWYNAENEEEDEATDSFTRPDGTFLEAVAALANLSADETYQSLIADIRESRDSVTAYMARLNDPPEGYQNKYSAAKDCYDAYMAFTDVVLNPTGDLQSFADTFDAADTNVNNTWEALQLFINA